MLYNQGAINSISFYFKTYLERCIQKNKTFLNVDDYFELNVSGQIILNYSRLFYEIPIYCKNKLEKQTL